MTPETYPETVVWLCCLLASLTGLIAGYVLGFSHHYNRTVNRRRRFWQQLTSTTRKQPNQCN